MSVTSKLEAINKVTLIDDPQKLIREIEENIKMFRDLSPEYLRPHARGGHYTRRARAIVAELYRSKGWTVDDSGYWMTLS